MSKAWYAFFWSILAGVLIGTGLYLLTVNILASVLLGLGIWAGVIYFISVGLTVISNNLAEIRKLLENKS